MTENDNKIVFYKNKRVITIYQDYVLKSHEVKEHFDKEVQDLKDLSFFDCIEISDSWKLRVPKILDVDYVKLEFSMEKITGMTLDEAIQENKKQIPWKKLGEVLALLHNQRIVSGNTIYLYGDFTRPNIFVNYEEQTIGLIDPGPRYGLIAPHWRDVLIFDKNIWYGQLKHKLTLRKELKLFMKAYKHTFEGDLKAKGFYKSLQGEWDHILYSSKAHKGIFKYMYIVYGGIWYILKLYQLLKLQLLYDRGVN